MARFLALLPLAAAQGFGNEFGGPRFGGGQFWGGQFGGGAGAGASSYDPMSGERAYPQQTYGLGSMGQYGGGAGGGAGMGAGGGGAGSPLGMGGGAMGGSSPYGQMGIGYPGMGQQMAGFGGMGGMGQMNPFGQLSIGQGGGGQFQSDNQFAVPNDVAKPTAGGVGEGGARRIVPDFLKGADKETEDKFYAIVQHPSWSPAEKQARIEEFMQGLGSSHQQLYSSSRRSEISSLADKRQRVLSAVEQMGESARQYFQKVSALMTSATLSESSRLKQIQDLYNTIPDNVKKEFDEKLAGI